MKCRTSWPPIAVEAASNWGLRIFVLMRPIKRERGDDLGDRGCQEQHVAGLIPVDDGHPEQVGGIFEGRQEFIEPCAVRLSILLVAACRRRQVSRSRAGHDSPETRTSSRQRACNTFASGWAPDTACGAS